MKRHLIVLATIMVLISMVFAAPANAGKQFVTICSGGTTGVYFALGGGLSNVLNTKGGNLSATVESTGGTVANMRLLAKGEADLGFGVADIVYYAYMGIQQFEKEGKERYKNLRSIASLYPEAVQIVTLASSGINTVADLKGKSVAVGATGSGTMVNAKLVLGLYGLSFDDVKVNYLGFGEASMGIADRTLDAGFIWAGVPTASIIDLSALNKVQLVSITPDVIDKIKKDWPFFSVVSIPKTTYKGMVNDATTVAAPALLMTTTKMSNETAYQITKLLFENVDMMKSSHAKGGDINLETAFEGLAVPLHPGAVKYYKEKGVSIPEKLMPKN